jgi:hypothetical protein
MNYELLGFIIISGIIVIIISWLIIKIILSLKFKRLEKKGRKYYDEQKTFNNGPNNAIIADNNGQYPSIYDGNEIK